MTRPGFTAEEINCHGTFADGEPVLTTAPVMDEEDARVNEYREAAKLGLDFFRRGAMFVKGYKNQPFAFDCWLLALGWVDILGHYTCQSLADRWGVKKATVSKCVKKIQAAIGHGLDRLVPMPGQRSLAACRKFKTARKNKLL